MRWKPHVRFGGQAGETDGGKHRHGAPVRSHLTNQALTRCRQRVQQATLEHRGWKGDPLYDIRKLLLLGAERVDDTGWARLHAALDAGTPTTRSATAGSRQENIRDIYLTDDPELAAERLDDAITWCAAAESGPELRRLLNMPHWWRAAILAHHRTGASNGPVEAANSSVAAPNAPASRAASRSPRQPASSSPLRG